MAILNPRSKPGQSDPVRGADAMAVGDAADRVLSALRAGSDPDPRAFAVVVSQLRAGVARQFPDVNADDVVQATLIQFLRRSKHLDTQIEDPWSYLRQAARNSAHDATRVVKRRREAQLDEQAPSADDAVAALIDRRATHERVVAAMQEAIAAGDQPTVRLITKWLDLADELGRAPVTREVASRAGVSHTTVAKALKRFRSLLEPDT